MSLMKTTILILMMVSGSSAWWYKRVNVVINNLLPEGHYIEGHCKSGDNDLGVVRVAPNAELHFSFKPNFWGTTLFHCGVVSEGYGVVKFAAYDFNRDNNERCINQCYWGVEENGIHGLDEKTRNVDINYAWGPIQV